MTAIPSIHFPPMDMANQDEHMDFASDHPFHDDNDVDFDAVSMQDASRGPSVEADVMIEDFTEPTDDSKPMADDEMLDEDLIGDEPTTIDENFDNDEDGNSATMYDDEDLLYEDDEVLADDAAEQEDVDLGDGEALLEPEGDAVHEEHGVLDEETVVQLNEIQTESATTAIPDTQSFETIEDGQENYDISVTRSEETRDFHEDGYGRLENKEHDTAIEGNGSEAVQPPETSSGDVHSLDDGSNIHVRQQTSNDNVSTNNLVNVPQPAQTTDASDAGQEHSKEENSDGAETAGDQVQALHPVKVQYDGTELCLFPPIEGADTFFVQDSSLAFSPCDQLLGACREVLGDSLAEGHELVLDFPTMGLHLSEGSTYSRQLTISQILDIYLALCLNDGHESPAPLVCILRTRISLASQYAFLLSAASEGKGLIDVQAYDHADSSAPEELLHTGHSDNSTSEAVDRNSWNGDESPAAEPPPGVSSTQRDTSNEPNVPGPQEAQARDAEEPEAEIPSESEKSASGQYSLEEGVDGDSAPAAEFQDVPEVETQNTDSRSDVAEKISTGDSDSDDTIRGETIETGPVESQLESTIGIAVTDFATGDGVKEPKVDISGPSGTSTASGPHDDQPQAILLETTDADDEDTFSEISDNLLGLDEFNDQIEHDAEYEDTKADADVSESTISAEGEVLDKDHAGHSKNYPDDSPEVIVNGQAAKRKALDEDDFDLLEPETPEKKKRRPS